MDFIMDSIQVIESLRTIKKLCQETPDCKKCRLHSKEDDKTCGVAAKGASPAIWDFDLDPEESVPSIFK